MRFSSLFMVGGFYGFHEKMRKPGASSGAGGRDMNHAVPNQQSGLIITTGKPVGRKGL
jgi:hypothetical protein